MFHCGIGWAIRTDLPFGIDSRGAPEVWLSP